MKKTKAKRVYVRGPNARAMIAIPPPNFVVETEITAKRTTPYGKVMYGPWKWRIG